MRILLIDDDITQKNFVEQALPVGTEVVYAGTLEGGISYLDDHDVDLVLLDIRLPNIWNYGEGYRRLSGFHPEVPVVGFTAFPDDQFADGLIREGLCDMYYKPDNSIEPEIAERQLRTKVVKALGMWDYRQKQLQSLSAVPALITDLRNDLRELSKEIREIKITVVTNVSRIEIVEKDILAVSRRHDLEDTTKIQSDLDKAKSFGQRGVEREKGIWSVVIKVVGILIPLSVGAFNWGRIREWWNAITK
jgi:response regulator RpfG family c-di-GMP phosphodiesterase